MNSSLYRRKNLAPLFAFLCGLAVVVGNLWTARQVSVVLPLVDGWAVWSRVIDLKSGAINWGEYLFRPHGAHLHSIVYLLAWFDYWLADADQSLMRIFSLCAVAAFSALLGCLVWAWGSMNGQSASAKILAVSATTALLTSVIDTETLIQPFQAVLSISRLTYFVLLAGFVIALTRRKPLLYVTSLILSMVAISFHGSGYLFALLVITAHMLLTRDRVRIGLSILPLVTVIAIQRWYSVGSSELQQLYKVLSPNAVIAFLQGTSAFFATPFRILRSHLGDRLLLLLGFTFFLATVYITTVALIAVLRDGRGIVVRWASNSNESREHQIRTELLTLAFLAGAFVLLSSAAASMFWLVRTSGGTTMAAHLFILDSARYAAYSSLAPVMLLCFLSVQIKKASVFTPLCAILLLAIGVWPAIDINQSYQADDELNKAAVALSVGLSPLQPEAEAIWPMASADWYWSANLPKTVASLQTEQRSIWGKLPPMGATIDGPVTRLPISLIDIRPITAIRIHNRCGIRGTLPDHNGQPRSSTIFAVVSSQKEVIGYVVMLRHHYGLGGKHVEGFLRCGSDIKTAGPLFLASATPAWHVDTKFTARYSPAFNVTDSTWVKGVARNWSGFFVEVSPASEAQYQSGDILRFADGQLRLVISTSKTGPYLNIFLDGGPLDGNVVGYPETVELIN